MNIKKGNIIMNKRIVSIIAAASLLVLTGCGKQKDADMPVSATTGTNVSVYDVTKTGISSSVTYTGEIKPAEAVSVSAKASGTAKSVNADIGKYVRAGDTLLVIDSTNYQLQYNQALAAYNSAQAAYNSTVGGAQQQNVNKLSDAVTLAQQEYDNALSSYNREKELYENDTNLVSARNALQNAKDTYERTQSLFDMGAASQTTLDSARILYENAEAAVKTAESNLKTSFEAAKSRLSSAETNLASAKESYNLTVNVLNPESEATAKAQVASAKAALDIAKHTLDNTTVKAPISGYVSSKNISRGEVVAQGVPLFTISDTSSVEGEISVTEVVIPSVKVGTPAVISVKAAGIEGISGSVSVVNSVKNETTGLYTVRVNIPNSDSVLKSGMFAEIELITNTSDNAITIPSKALMQEGNDYYVYVVDETTNTAEKRYVDTGIADTESIEIVEGLSDGEVVVVSGKEYLSEKNNQVNITERENENTAQ